MAAFLLVAIPATATKSRTLCGLTLAYPEDWLLVSRATREPDCPDWATLTPDTGTARIEITTDRIEDGDWAAAAAARAVICDADGPDGGRTCDLSKGKTRPFELRGRRAVEASAPIVDTHDGVTTIPGEMRAFAIELSTAGRILILQSEHPEAFAVLNLVARSLRPASSADAAVDAGAADAAAHERRLLAAGPRVEVRESEGYRLVASYPALRECVLNLDFHGNYDRCYPNNLPARLYKRDIKLAFVDAVHMSHVHPFEVRGDELLYIKRAGTVPRGGRTSESDPWIDELWVLDLKSGRKEKTAATKGLSFHASDDGRIVYYSNGSRLWRLERPSKASVLVHEENAHQIDLGAFAPDGAFEFCLSDEGDCFRRAKVIGGIVTWLEP